MGFPHYSDADYQARTAFRAKTGTPTFAHNAAVATGVTSGIHPTLDPLGVKVRESRDSTNHPEAVPVAVLFDVTGSMDEVPKTVQQKLPQLMGLLIRQGYLEHPAIMVGAIGDANSDRYPLQVGQFESGIEIDDNLTNLILERGGGGQIKETYELGMYFLARKTVHDHWEKRGEKGYVFLIGDEKPYDAVRRDQVERHIGDRPEADIPVEQVVAELKERYHVYFILPRLTSYFDDKRVRGRWQELLGENLILLEDPAGVCECIAAQIGLVEGTVDEAQVTDDLVAFGSSASMAQAVSKALVPVGAGGRKAKGAIQQVPDSGSPSGLSSF